ncbi:MAG: alpha-glucan family phosphorylase [Phycisphaerae bacterium]|nr:alpha-glucan family phosphorylase [Phycisphaerae bacterium]
MHTVRTFVVVPSLPNELMRLKEIANNMWWCWDHDAIDLFRRLDRDLWEKCYHNPVKMLGQLSQEKLDAARNDRALLAHLERVCDKMDHYMQDQSWYDTLTDSKGAGTIAYFSAEFALNECLPLYSGGLGVLAGDHLKSASDLGVNLVGVGLLYRQGYFQQYLNADGWQQEAYPENDFYNMPVSLVMYEDGRPIRFHVDVAGQDVVVQVWKVQVGRINLYLLDTNLRCNKIEDRQITSQLYGGDNNMRLRQEIILGVGGYRALQAVGINPAVCHMNEGHAAFLSLERVRQYMEKYNLNFTQAREATICGNVFTTHTPVPAGHDAFSPGQMEKHFSNFCKQLGLKWEDFIALGRNAVNDANSPFSMTNLALKMSVFRNGVSELHGEVSRHMCQNVWEGVPAEEVPIDSITNGIHVRSWISHEMSDLFDRYLGPEWFKPPMTQASFKSIDEIPDEEIWRTHERRRERLVSFARKHVRNQLKQRGSSPADIALCDEILDPEALTIGFARRFATYKRGALLFRDVERFAKLLSNKDRPVQILFAGKSHPRDTEGKELIRTIIHHLGHEEFRRRVVFLENYDINVARYLVQGVDVWLNTPRRGMEASGTSGMKVLANGGLNCSILDGWWCEGYNREVGWAIGQGESYQDKLYEDEVESHMLYNLLENEIIPLYYDRGPDRLPRNWIQRMKNSIQQITPVFSTSRMVSDYTEKFYLPAAVRYSRFNSNERAIACELADWKAGIYDRWNEVQIGKVDVISSGELLVGGKLQARCHVNLGSIAPEDVSVEMYQGPLDSQGAITNGIAVPMECIGQAAEGQHIFNGFIPCQSSGLCGFSIRVIPSHPELADKYDLRLIRWEQTDLEPASTATKC